MQRFIAAFTWSRRSVIRFVQIGCFVHLVNEHVLEIRACAGPSMYPTLALKGDYLLSLRMSTLRTFFSRTPPHVSRGDLIDFVSPTDPTYSVCKRVIGIEGDVVCLDPSKSPSAFIRQAQITAPDALAEEPIGRSHVRLDGSLEPEDDQFPLRLVTDGEVGPFIRVPRGYIWAVGDNLSNSTDSRAYGPVPLGLIRGKIIARLWPPSKAQWLTSSKDGDAVQQHIPLPTKIS
ncbi:LexA/Signal peptidase [Cystobasidium minutum MCA 4210]|uniref:LexA/Signal peptidase n=1 Tax=Cystobasidium minutum MCA 4210 TaxID=1397322 RepID=UPI0034CD2B5B|eukprot:jgi/Rhomi1/106835/CE106834_329